MRNNLLEFYKKDDFIRYKNFKHQEGFTILGVTSFVQDLEALSGFNTENIIVDLSALTEYINIQSLGEKIVLGLSPSPIFICDISKREMLEYELRLAFDNFELIDSEIIGTVDKANTSIEASEGIAKRHKKITDLEEDQLEVFFDSFTNSLYGHPKFKDDFTNQIRTFRVFNKLGEHKILSLFLMGESGVGKTEVARAIFNSLKGEKKLAQINFGNYSNEFSLSSLIGSARGYIGSDDGEIFMKVRNTDIGILLIDEFEKSNATLFNYFLEVLESGKMTNSLGEEMDLNGLIIIFTSNISRDNFKKKISPELRSRFDYICVFTLLSSEDKIKYIEYRANTINEKVTAELNISIFDSLRDFLLVKIDVSKYENMRDINRQIKKVFIEYLSIFHSKEQEVFEDDTHTKYSLLKRLASVFKS